MGAPQAGMLHVVLQFLNRFRQDAAQAVSAPLSASISAATCTPGGSCRPARRYQYLAFGISPSTRCTMPCAHLPFADELAWAMT